jgi:CubicO group peptidase (beta-lactamase class C family)
MSIWLALVLAGMVSIVWSQAGPPFPDARATDPAALGWMQGTPPPPSKIIRIEDGSFLEFPKTRWSFSHMRELVPTVHVPRGSGPVSVLPRAERPDIDNIPFTPLGGSAPSTWRKSLEANYTDGIVVLHRGRIVYERYMGALTPEGHHIAFSVTKSFFGTLAAALIAEGKLDAKATVARYLPELERNGFGDATVAQVLDMTTGVKFIEDYNDPASDYFAYRSVQQPFLRPASYKGPDHVYDYLATLEKKTEHGAAFQYRSVHTDVLAWILTRVTGRKPAELLSERIWAPMGAEDDASLRVGPAGIQMAAGGLNCRLRDLARFGEMIRLHGRFNGRQIIPAAAVADIEKGGSPQAFAGAGYKTLPNGSYHNQWWILHNSDGAFAARGIHGQGIYIDPKAEMVIARFASHPMAGNLNLDPTTLPAFHALALHLMARPR